MSHQTTDLKIIHKAVCIYFNLELIDLFKRTRKRKILVPRQWFHYLSRELNPKYLLSLNEIGCYFEFATNDSWDHASIIHSCKQISGHIDFYKESKETKVKLLELIEIKVKSLGVEYIWTWTAAYEGLAFYLKQGYKSFTEFDNFYPSGHARVGVIKKL